MPNHAEKIAQIAQDPMCYPQLNPKKDFRDPGVTFAQELRQYIEATVESPSAENPKIIVIY